ncbi:MAG: chain-length determining protein, partial [Cyanobacteria bacterium K_DeepCast_35m_m1_288]|nr:chain-length determining protein [Cyanobacteria bacterium K_DeepCast_35m_m1_288]
MVDPSVASEGLDFKEVWKALMRRRRIVVAATGVALLITALYTAQQRLFNAQYSGGFQLLITDPVSDQSSGGGAGAGAGAGAGGASFGALALNNTNRFDLPTLLGVLQSPLLLDEIARRYGRAPVGLSVTPARGIGPGQVTGILNVDITGTDPRSDQRLLQGVAEVYLAYSLNQRQQRLTEGLRFLDKQAPALEAKLSAIQAEVAAFRQRYNLLNPEEDANALKTELLNGERQILILATERQRLLQASRSIANGSLTTRGYQEAIGSGGGGGSSGGSVGSGGFTLSDSSQNLLIQLDKADEQLAEARSRFAESSPMVRGLQARRARLLPLLRNAQMETLRAALSSNANSTSAAQRQQQRLAAVFRQQPALIKTYDNLQQRLEISKTNLAGLLQTRENLQVEIAQRTVPWKVIAPPRMNPTLVSPSVPKNLAAGLLLGLAAGSGLALLRDRLDHVFHSPAEVKDDLDHPLLGHIPHV